VRLVGGAAIWIRASERARGLLGRDYPDLDLVAHRKQSRPLRDLLEELDYEPERTFNATHGARRLLYHARDRSFHLDVFLDEFVMSHTLDLGARLEIESPTLPAARRWASWTSAPSVTLAPVGTTQAVGQRVMLRLRRNSATALAYSVSDMTGAPLLAERRAT